MKVLVNGLESLFTLPIKSNSDFIDIKERILTISFEIDCENILIKIKLVYRKFCNNKK